MTKWGCGLFGGFAGLTKCPETLLRGFVKRAKPKTMWNGCPVCQEMIHMHPVRVSTGGQGVERQPREAGTHLVGTSQDILPLHVAAAQSPTTLAQRHHGLPLGKRKAGQQAGNIRKKDLDRGTHATICRSQKKVWNGLTLDIRPTKKDIKNQCDRLVKCVYEHSYVDYTNEESKRF